MHYFTSSPSRLSKKFLFLIHLTLMSLPLSLADVKGTSGNIFFDTNSDQLVEMTLNGTGLGIGKVPSQKLDVAGNALITRQLFVGGNTGSSNLNVNGTLGFSAITYTNSSNVGDYSYIFANPVSAGSNIELVLPYAGNVTGREITIKQISAGNTTLINGGGGSIDGAPFVRTNSSNLSALNLISSGNHWNILSTYGGINSLTVASMSNLVLWYDGDDIDGDGVSEGVLEHSSNYESSSGNVKQWNDKSGSAYHLTAVSGNTLPVLSINALNNRAAVYFTADAIGNSSNSPNLGQGDHFGVYYRHVSTGNDWQYFWLFQPSNEPRLYTTRSDNAYLGNAFNANNFSDGTEEVDGVLTKIFTTSSWHLFFSTAQKDWEARTEGINVGNPLSVTRTLNGGYIAEMLFFNRHLSLAERRQVEAYLKKKWNLNNTID
jgi:hypothetical protein